VISRKICGRYWNVTSFTSIYVVIIFVLESYNTILYLHRAVNVFLIYPQPFIDWKLRYFNSCHRTMSLTTACKIETLQTQSHNTEQRNVISKNKSVYDQYTISTISKCCRNRISNLIVNTVFSYFYFYINKHQT